jgi:hypothetical protein
MSAFNTTGVLLKKVRRFQSVQPTPETPSKRVTMATGGPKFGYSSPNATPVPVQYSRSALSPGDTSPFTASKTKKLKPGHDPFMTPSKSTPTLTLSGPSPTVARQSIRATAPKNLAGSLRDAKLTTNSSTESSPTNNDDATAAAVSYTAAAVSYTAGGQSFDHYLSPAFQDSISTDGIRSCSSLMDLFYQASSPDAKSSSRPHVSGPLDMVPTSPGREVASDESMLLDDQDGFDTIQPTHRIRPPPPPVIWNTPFVHFLDPLYFQRLHSSDDFGKFLPSHGFFRFFRIGLNYLYFSNSYSIGVLFHFVSFCYLLLFVSFR